MVNGADVVNQSVSVSFLSIHSHFFFFLKSPEAVTVCTGLPGWSHQLQRSDSESRQEDGSHRQVNHQNERLSSSEAGNKLCFAEWPFTKQSPTIYRAESHKKLNYHLGFFLFIALHTITCSRVPV